MLRRKRLANNKNIIILEGIHKWRRWTLKRLLLLFGAGCLGALVNSLAVWWVGDLGLARALGVAVAPALTKAWLYPRIVWGGIWGWLFFLPLLNSRPLVKGALLSLGPTLVQLLVIFPYQANKGVLGLELGTLTPVLVLIYNSIWGVVTALAIRYSR